MVGRLQEGRKDAHALVPPCPPREVSELGVSTRVPRIFRDFAQDEHAPLTVAGYGDTVHTANGLSDCAVQEGRKLRKGDISRKVVVNSACQGKNLVVAEGVPIDALIPEPVGETVKSYGLFVWSGHDVERLPEANALRLTGSTKTCALGRATNGLLEFIEED